MKNSVAVARQTQATEAQAENVQAIKDQLDRVETMLGTLLEALAHNTDTESKPNAVGRPKGK
jgi:Tfp pilus assembly protein PilO